MLETILELTVASLLGITLKENILAEKMTDLDTFSYYSAYVTLFLGSAFILLSLFVTCVGGKVLVKIRR